ncbi:hypothetical protein [Rhizomonospora bruguierae]|nr:hypothetical protein [Micromonospora sp. NBRC 107566]
MPDQFARLNRAAHPIPTRPDLLRPDPRRALRPDPLGLRHPGPRG